MSAIIPGVTALSKNGSALLKGAVTLSEGSGVTLTQSGHDIAIAASGGGSATPFVGVALSYASLDNALFSSGTNGAVASIDNSINEGLTLDSGSTINAEIYKAWSLTVADVRANALPVPMYGYWILAQLGGAGSSNTFARWFSSSNDGTVKTANQIGIDLSKSSGTVAPKTSSGDGTTEEATAITGLSYSSGVVHVYKMVWSGSSIDFYVDGTLKNTQSTHVPARTSGTVIAYYSLLYNKITTANVNRLVATAYSWLWQL